MAAIDPIYNGESGASVRAKLNELIDTVNSGSTTINVGDAPLFDPNKAGGYEAGSIISYKNESSPDPEFHEFKIYLALTDIPQGVGPEDSADWKNEGATVEVAGGNTANGVVQNITRLRELTGMRTGHSVTVEDGGHVYVFNEGSEAGVKPFAPGIGSWELKYTKSVVEWQPGTYRSSPTLVLRNNAIYRLTRPVPFESTDFEAEASDPTPVWEKVSGGGGHVFEDQSGTALPTRSVAKAGAGIEFEDDAVNEKTVIRVDENTMEAIRSKTYSIDFGLHAFSAQEINMLGPAVISNVAVNNVSSLLLTWSGGLQQAIVPGLNNIEVAAGDILTWEITRTNTGQLATLGIHLSLNE